MALAPGTRLGPYAITAPLGAGGMGEVYKATDTKLKRQVAIKVLPESLASDAERLARFQREAEVLASLNHPNIAQIYGLEDADGVKALVMELVEGPTLADRIAKGAIPIEEALPIAKQLAEALEAAHEQGIIHRDLKPANIKVRPDGTVKVLDFGLAKAMEPVGALSPSISQSPTITTPAMTQAGMILGTAAYMSPEQARGKTVDKRTDIWAFGCVLYEMLTGRRAFGGEDVADTLGNVLKVEPDWAALPPTAPTVSALVHRCLEKDRRRRIADISTARFVLDEAAERPRVELPARRVPWLNRPAWRLGLLAGLAVVGVAVGVGGRFGAVESSSGTELRLQIATPPNADLDEFKISPDGRQLAFIAGGQVFVRSLSGEDAQPLPGTQGANESLFWSADSRSVAFKANGVLKRVDIANGIVRTLAEAPSGWGGAWGVNGTILFSVANTGPIYRVPATGGIPVPATRFDPSEHTSHLLPHFLPDGRRFLFLARAGQSHAVYAGSLDSTDIRRVIESDTEAAFLPPGYVLFARKGVLLAQELDLNELRVVGEPVPLARHIAQDRVRNGQLALSVSAAGLVAYRPDAGMSQLVWFDRTGREVGRVGPADDAQPAGIRLSSREDSVLLMRLVEGNVDVWTVDLSREVLRRLTFDTRFELNPIWSPDGRQVVFSSNRKGNLDLYVQTVEGPPAEAPLLETKGETKRASDWSRDGRYIVYDVQTQTAPRDLWAIPMFGNRKPFPIAQGKYLMTSARFSPDGRWLAYQSDESGRNEIYVQAFPGGGSKQRISSNGGTVPQWCCEGRELFYLAIDNRLMAVSTTLGGETVRASAPVPLFGLTPGSGYAVTSDGQRFLVPAVTREQAPITVILNWQAASR